MTTTEVVEAIEARVRELTGTATYALSEARAWHKILNTLHRSPEEMTAFIEEWAHNEALGNQTRR